jgi:DNA replication protein DnaC
MSSIAARLPLILGELRLPTIKRLWAGLAEQSNKEGWPAERFLTAVMEHELAERETRRLERHRLESQLLPGKLLSSFDFTTVPTVSKAHVIALAEGDGRSPRFLRNEQSFWMILMQVKKIDCDGA